MEKRRYSPIWTFLALAILALFIIFVVLKLFFFPNFLKTHAGDDKAGYVAGSLVERAAPD